MPSPEPAPSPVAPQEAVKSAFPSDESLAAASSDETAKQAAAAELSRIRDELMAAAVLEFANKMKLLGF